MDKFTLALLKDLFTLLVGGLMAFFIGYFFAKYDIIRDRYFPDKSWWYTFKKIQLHCLMERYEFIFNWKIRKDMHKFKEAIEASKKDGEPFKVSLYSGLFKGYKGYREYKG